MKHLTLLLVIVVLLTGCSQAPATPSEFCYSNCYCSDFRSKSKFDQYTKTHFYTY